jgi:O-antigen/teichoic acid export membrane protein
MHLSIKRNVAFSVVEVVFTSASLFVVYKLMTIYLPLREIGVWSLVAAATSMARLGDLGVGVGVTRFVAKAVAEDKGSHAAVIVETALISVAGIYILLSIISFVPLYFVLKFFLSEPQLSQGRQILPLALISFVLGNINGVILSALAGLQRSYVKSIVIALGSLALFASSAILMPFYHLPGVLAAQIFQAVVVLIFSWIALKQIMSALPLLPSRWELRVVKELVSYGSQIQLVNVLVFFYEPLTKMIMSSFGGLEALALFEMANRLVGQTRALIVSANQSLIPAYTDLSIRKLSDMFALFDKNVRYTTISVMICLALFVFAVPATSIILLGRLDENYILISIVLAFGWFLNTLTTPIYFLALGLGKLKYNTISHFVIAIGCAPMAIILGHLFGTIGVVSGATASLVFGTLIVFLSYLFVFRPMRVKG